MQEHYPVVGEQQFAFKTSVGFIDHLQEFLGATLSSTPLVIPPFTLLKENMLSFLDFLEVILMFSFVWILRSLLSRFSFFCSYIPFYKSRILFKHLH